MRAFVLACLVLISAGCTDASREPARAEARRVAEPGALATTAEDEDSGPREAVCHKGRKTLELPAPAVRAHLGHGDQRGACPARDVPGDVEAPDDAAADA